MLLHEQGLSISYDGAPLNPDENIKDKTSTTFQFGETEPTQTAELLIIEWKAGKHRTLHFGADDEHFVYEESLRDLEASFNYSAYVTWSGFDQEALSTIGLGESAQGHVGPLYIAARKAIANHFTDRRRQRRREQVKKWKEDKVYPYEGEPETETERAERAVFDVVSGTLSTQISGKKSDTRLTLALLKSALRAAPESLQTILHEVVSLNEDDRSALTSLLGEVTLPADHQGGEPRHQPQQVPAGVGAHPVRPRGLRQRRREGPSAPAPGAGAMDLWRGVQRHEQRARPDRTTPHSSQPHRTAHLWRRARQAVGWQVGSRRPALGRPGQGV